MVRIESRIPDEDMRWTTKTESIDFATFRVSQQTRLTNALQLEFDMELIIEFDGNLTSVTRIDL